jgi:hypothetical protein
MDVVLPALKPAIVASAQSFLSLLVGAVITAFTAVGTAPAAIEANIVAGHAFAHLDFKVCAALDTGCFNVPNAFTG